MDSDWLFYLMIALMPSMVVLAILLWRDPSDERDEAKHDH
jgi:hypothetical protein